MTRNRRSLPYGEMQVPKSLGPFVNCPTAEVEKLTLQLQMSVTDSRPQPELQRRFSQAGFGRLIDVKLERLGQCADQPKPFFTGM